MSLGLLFSNLVMPVAEAISAEQKALFNAGIHYYDVCNPNPSDNGSGSGGSANGTPTGGVTFDDSQSSDTGNQTTVDDDGVDPSPTGSPFHQSSTSYADGQLGALHTNYIALNPGWSAANGLVLGDVAALTYKGKTIYAVYGDNHVGNTPHAEISVKAILALSGQTDPKQANNLTGVHFAIYPGTHTQLNGSVDQTKIDQIGAQVSGAGLSSPSATTSNPSSSGNCCPPTNTAAGATAAGATIVLDPGHSPATDPNQVDSTTGLYVQDYANEPEMTNAYTAATKIESRLQKDGYKVVLTKSSAQDKLNLAERADRINKSSGDLVVTLHSDSGISGGFLMYPDQNSRRIPGGGKRLDGTDGLVHPSIEAPSKKAAETMAPVIAQSATSLSGETAKSFFDEYGSDGLLGNGKNPGNTPVQTILTAIPAVYSEVNQNLLATDTFAGAMTKAIEKAVPLSSSNSSVTSANTPISASNNGISTCCPSALTATVTSGSVPASLTGSDNEHKAYNFFLQVGLSPAQAAGVVANLVNESGVDPLIAGPNPSGQNVWGVAQWTGASIQGYIADKARNNISGPDGDLLTQLTVLWAEMNGKSSTWSTNIIPALKQITDPGAAAVYFRDNFERCDMSVSSCADRASVGSSEFRKLGNGSGPIPTSGGNCQNPSGSPDCLTAVGSAKIICEAKKYDPTSYIWGGGHGSPADWHKQCPTIGPGCGEDCSGLVDLAVYDAFKVDLQGQNTDGERADPAHWKQIQLSQVQPGDIVQPDTGHVEIIDHVSGGTLHTFGAHTAKVAQPDQVGPVTWPASTGYTYWHYIGPGA